MLLIAPPYYGIDTSIARAFERNGIKPLLVNTRKPKLWESALRKLTKRSHLLKKAVLPLMKISLIEKNKEYIMRAEEFNPSFIFIVKGETVFPQTLKILKDKLKVPCLSYQWDDPFFSSEDKNEIDECRRRNFVQGMHEYDHIFVFDTHYVGEIKKKGSTNISYLPLATDEEIYREVELTDPEKAEYGYDVCFVGVPFENRLRIFNSLQGLNVGVFGDNWKRHRHEMNSDYFRGEASGEKVLKLYIASNIVLNIHHPQSISGLNTRTFDIPSCGSFEIVDYKAGLQELFDIGDEIICYNSIEELIDKVKYYLSNPAERNRIARKGYDRVRKEHTWFHRMKKVIECVGKV